MEVLALHWTLGSDPGFFFQGGGSSITQGRPMQQPCGALNPSTDSPWRSYAIGTILLSTSITCIAAQFPMVPQGRHAEIFCLINMLNSDFMLKDSYSGHHESNFPGMGPPL